MQDLETLFPKIAGTNYKITSPSTIDYNCIAWAVEDVLKWWWPFKPYFWPQGVKSEETIEAFIAAFESVGYEICQGGELEPAFQQIALYVDATETPTHAARQLQDGRWTSKIGQLEDIEHDTADDLVGHRYGRVANYLRKPI